MKDIPHNRTFLVFGRDLVTLCDECAAAKSPLMYQGVGATIRRCNECGRSPSEVASAYGDMVERDTGSGEA